MVPVGGSIIYSPQGPKTKDGVGIIEKINRNYPGRASAGPIHDLFITYLEMGETNLKKLLIQRKENYNFLLEELTILMKKYGESVLINKNNKISIASTLIKLNDQIFKPNGIDASFFGSYLFHRRVSGVRVCG